MKTIQLLSLLLFATITVLHAQDSKYGIRAGVNLSKINSKDIPANLEDGRLGFAFGFFAEYAITENLWIQPELQYASLGNKENDLKVDYLLLPLVFKYYLTPSFNLQLGPQGGIKIWEWERNTNYKTFDVAAVGGLGYNITENIFIAARYAFGIINIFEDKNSLISQPNLEGSNQNIQVSLGYKL